MVERACTHTNEPGWQEAVPKRAAHAHAMMSEIFCGSPWPGAGSRTEAHQAVEAADDSAAVRGYGRRSSCGGSQLQGTGRKLSCVTQMGERTGNNNNACSTHTHPA